MSPTVKRSPSVAPLPLSRGKQAAFRAIMVLSPVVLFACLELALRWWWTGPDLRLFHVEQVDGVLSYVMNAGVKDRYFYGVPFAPSASPDAMPVDKGPQVFRIVCLGASTTVGYPYWYNGSFSTFLRERLQVVFPDRSFEVMNLGMTATNSFTVNDMARELAVVRPDLIVVYDGHNEFYGAFGVSSNVSLGRSRWLVKVYLRLLHLRTFVWLRELVGRITGSDRSQQMLHRGTMMERLARGQLVPLGGPVYSDGLETFRANLKELHDLCMDEGIPLILSTQVGNIKDRPPFVSASPTAFSPERLRALSDSSTWTDGSEREIVQAARVDTLCADLQYLAGRMLLRRSPAEARPYFVRARDLDELRFRASSDFNAAILDQQDGDKVRVVDMEEVFARSTPQGIPGSELIMEHLHPYSRGYFLMAKAFADTMRSMGLVAPDSAWSLPTGALDERLWDQRPVTELDERIARRRTEVLISGWPFKDQFPTVDAVSPTDTLGLFAENATNGTWDWRTAHEAALNWLERRGDRAEVLREDRALLSQSPREIALYHRYARHLLEMRRLDDMRDVLLASLRIAPTPLARRALGDYYLNAGDPAEAAVQYRLLLQFPQTSAERMENGYLLSLACVRSGRLDEGKQILLALLNLNPDYAPAVKLLGAIASGAKH